MKKLLTLCMLTCLFSVANAQAGMTAEEMKSLALASCDAQANEETNAAEKADILKSCKCVVDNTDYKALLELQKADNIQKMQEMMEPISKKCAVKDKE